MLVGVGGDVGAAAGEADTEGGFRAEDHGGVDRQLLSAPASLERSYDVENNAIAIMLHWNYRIE